MPTESVPWGWTTWVLIVVALFAGLQLLRLVLVLLNLLRHVLQRPAYRHVDGSTVPPAVREGLAPVLGSLCTLGFEVVGYLAVRRLFAVARDEVPRAVLRSADGVTWATVGYSDLPEPHNLFHVILHSFLDDGQAVFTVNGAAHNVIGVLPDTRLEDPLVLDAAAQAQHHAATLAGLRERRAQRLGSVEALVAALLRVENRYVDALLQRGWLLPTAQPERYRFSLWAALHGAWRILRGHGRLLRLQQQRQQALRAARQPSPQAPVEEEAAAFLDVEAIRQSPSPRAFWLALFATSLGLFALSATRWFEPRAVWLLAAVVLLHELGHYLAMRLFDYGNTTIFFVPFFGAATTGSKRDAPLWQELLVLLGGPLPGLGLAALLLWLRAPAAGSTLHELASMLILINLFNLLPVFPLDGGRLVHRLLFAHNRVLDALFKLLAAATFLGLGLAAGDGLLIALGAFIVLGIPSSLRLAGLQRRLAAAGTPPTPLAVFAAMRAAGHGEVPFAGRLAWARALLEQGTARARPGCLVALVWLALYGGLLVAGFVLTVRLFTAAAEPATAAPTWPEPAGEVLALHCPADPDTAWQAWRARPVPDAAASDTWVHTWLLGRFASDRQAEAADSLLGARDDGARRVRVENALLVEWDAAATATADHVEALGERLVALGARVALVHGDDEEYAEGEGVLELRCRPRDTEVRTRLARELRDHFAVPPHALARPPWWPTEGVDPLPEAQQRARSTLRELSEAQTAAITGGASALGPLAGAASLCLVSDDEARQQRVLEMMAERQREQQQVLQQHIDRRRGDPDFDVETAALFLSWQQAGFRDPALSMQRQRELGERLGALPAAGTVHGAPQTTPAARAQQAWATVVDEAAAPLRLFGLTLQQPSAGLPTLLAYLCARGCTEVELRQGQAVVDEASAQDP